jgi:CDP-diacylglycerol---serine O-phosphatidyltransferase
MALKSPQPWRTPKVYLLPNLMTAGNLACGFSAVFYIFQGMKSAEPSANTYYLAIGFVLAACLFDALDGRIARLRGQESMFGREFDSLADIVSFGIAPALLVMDIVLSGFPERVAWTIAFVYLLCGAMRLARFNCLAQMETETASKDFVGFPIPAAAGLIASLTVFILWLNEGDKEIGHWRYLLLVLVLVLSYMMMSEHSYPSFKKVNWRTRRSMPWVFAAIVVLVSAVNFWKFVPFIIFLSYLTYGCVRPWISRQWRREIEDGDEEFEPEIVSALEEEDPAEKDEPGESVA